MVRNPYTGGGGVEPCAVGGGDQTAFIHPKDEDAVNRHKDEQTALRGRRSNPGFPFPFLLPQGSGV